MRWGPGGENTVAPGDWCSAGVLYKTNNVPSERVFVCPSVQARVGDWFGPPQGGVAPYMGTRTPPFEKCTNPWPIQSSKATGMTYCRRRMPCYDDPILSGMDDVYNDTSGKQLLTTGVDGIQNTSSFSFMADGLWIGDVAMQSHVPGVNVVYLDGHVTYWTDPTWDGSTGKVLYDNGITSYSRTWNWYVDDIWMIIDGYHQPPVGQNK